MQEKRDVSENVFFVTFLQRSDFRCELLPFFFSFVICNRENALEIHLFFSSTKNETLSKGHSTAFAAANYSAHFTLCKEIVNKQNTKHLI